MTVVGARPQLVKAAIVSRALEAEGHTELVVHTGQHYDDQMSAIFFRELGMAEPHLNLAIGSMSHGAQTGRMLEALEKAMQDELPDWVLLYGDTNSTLAGALAASKLHLAVAHVEAGLRSFNRRMPEEVNRVVTDHLSAVLFAPTVTAVENLAREGIEGEAVQLVGDVMYDASLTFGGPRPIVGELGLEGADFVLATVHRAENTDDPALLENVFRGLVDVATRAQVVLPLHPRTEAALERAALLDQVRDALLVRPPIGYLDMLALEKAAQLVVTDSGGVQKEAFFAGTPCVTLRPETEWTELVEIGWNRLLAPDSEELGAQILAALEAGAPAPPDTPLYGGGHAARRIAEQLR